MTTAMKVGMHKSEHTLDDLIESKRRQLVEARMEVPLLRERVSQIRRDAALMTRRYEQRRARDFARIALEIEREADERESMCREHEFERTVVTYLRMYHSRSQPQKADVGPHFDLSTLDDANITIEGTAHHEKKVRMLEVDAGADPEISGNSSDVGVTASQAQLQGQTCTNAHRCSKRNRDVGIERAIPSSNAAETKSKRQTIEAYVKHTDATNARRLAIVEEYLTHIHASPPKIAMAVRDECVRCVSTKLLLCSSKSIMTCPECGYSVAYLDATSSSTSFDDVVEFSQYSYKRVNHFLMWLALVQGKEAHRVPDDILDAVMADLYHRQHISSTTEVTQKRVREALRRLRLRKAYDHVAQITARISGTRPPRISAEVEEQLKNMFLQMQPAFHKHTSKCRKNFLSYPYVLYRCFQILGLHHMLEGITLLKGRDKLEANDAIFRKMCDTLGWRVSDLPPASETTAAF